MGDHASSTITAEGLAGPPDTAQAIVDRLVAAVISEDILFVLLELSYLRAHAAGAIDTNHSTTGRTALGTALRSVWTKRMVWILKSILLCGASTSYDRRMETSSTFGSQEWRDILWDWDRRGEQSPRFLECKRLMGLSLEEAEAWLCEEELEPPGLDAETALLHVQVQQEVDHRAVGTIGLEQRLGPSMARSPSPSFTNSHHHRRYSSSSYGSPPDSIRRRFSPSGLEDVRLPGRLDYKSKPGSISPLMESMYDFFPPIIRLDIGNLRSNVTPFDVEQLLLRHAPSSSFRNIALHKPTQPSRDQTNPYAFVDFTHLGDARRFMATIGEQGYNHLASSPSQTLTIGTVPCHRILLSHFSREMEKHEALVAALRRSGILCIVKWCIRRGSHPVAVVSLHSPVCAGASQSQLMHEFLRKDPPPLGTTRWEWFKTLEIIDKQESRVHNGEDPRGTWRP